ncbi:hypothetical protein [Bradyrhizobium erythrophlei]|jgi:hypothetical protein|uniref:hypothetical protein n=1 Tax=Bradyrhizobium erythrophlei TaxID=1437360 RepID=UPI0012ABF1B9|nr:hypothetical protein [Bradyrhizobium erythrophlei]
MVLPSGFYGGLLQQAAGFVGNSIRPPEPGQPRGIPGLRARLAGRTLKFHPARTNRLQPSQNAAALLADLETIDIRRVGTHQSEYRRGVFRVKILTVDARLRAAMSHAQV